MRRRDETSAPTPRNRVVALLQGPSSYFFDLVGDALTARGAEAFRVCFCLGDRLFWRRKPVVWSRGRLGTWPATLEGLIRARGVTDLLMLGDSRPRHQAAIDVAARAGVRAHVVEHGYFRPDWLTHEIGGIGPRSAVRAAFLSGALDPSEAADAAELEDGRKRFASRFVDYAAMDVAYNLSNVFSRPLAAPFYAGHSSVPPLLEYAGWLRKLAVERARARRAAARWSALAAESRPLFLWALQLEADYAVRRDGAGAPQRALIGRVLASFARRAPAEAALVVKAHPLDNTLIHWRGRLARAAARLGVGDRVAFLDGGDLEAMLGRVSGVLSVNSTVGLRAIQRGVKTLALGDALYTLPGLSMAGGLRTLDAFWTEAFEIDPGARALFLGALRRRTQFRGAFDGEGAAPGAAALADRVLAAP